MMRRLIRNQSGMTLPLAMTMILLIGVMGAGLLTFVMRDIDAMVEVNRGQNAMDIAEAGVQAAKSHLRADPYRQHYDTDRANDCQAVYETYNDEDGNPVVHEPGGPRVGGDNWSKATQIWTDPDGYCVGTSTRTDVAGTPWREDQGVVKNFAGGKFHVTIECYDTQTGPNPTVPPNPSDDDKGPECLGGATDSSGVEEAPPEADVPSKEKKFFKITSTGYDNATGNGAVRKVEAIYYSSKKGHLPIAFFTPGDIDFAGGGTITVKKLSMFAGGNITGTQTGSGTPIADRCTPALYGDWVNAPYNTTQRVATADPCPAVDPATNVIVGAGFGAVGYVCGTSTPCNSANSVADGRNDYDASTGTKGQNKRFVYKEDGGGNPDPKRALAGNEIAFPFDPGTALEPGQAHTIIGLDLQEEMARAAALQGNYIATTGTHTINTADWPAQDPEDRVIYFVDGADVVFRVNTGNNDYLARGILVVRNGDLVMNNSSNGFEGLVIVIGNGTLPKNATENTGHYEQGGNVQLDGYVAASGSMRINGTINPSTSVDYTNLNTFYNINLWSWRELYK